MLWCYDAMMLPGYFDGIIVLFFCHRCNLSIFWKSKWLMLKWAGGDSKKNPLLSFLTDISNNFWSNHVDKGKGQGDIHKPCGHGMGKGFTRCPYYCEVGQKVLSSVHMDCLHDPHPARRWIKRISLNKVPIWGWRGGQKCPKFCPRGLYTIPYPPIFIMAHFSCSHFRLAHNTSFSVI